MPHMHKSIDSIQNVKLNQQQYNKSTFIKEPPNTDEKITLRFYEDDEEDQNPYYIVRNK